MIEDPIVAEIRKFRSEHTEKFNHDLDKICQDLKEKQNKSNRAIVARSPKLILDLKCISPLPIIDHINRS